MIPRTVRFHLDAVEEAEAATDWYAERSPRAAERFLDELTRGIDQVAENPERFPRFVFATRRMVLANFPYVIVFREIDTIVEIVAIAYGRRRPGYWRHRL